MNPSGLSAATVGADAPVVLILASGRGERFRASGGLLHKLDAPLLGKPMLQYALDAAHASGLPWHLERAKHDSMGDSIVAAVQETPSAAGWLILPADLPLILPSSLRAVALALGRTVAVVPVHRGQRGHPVGFSPACRDALLHLGGKQGAREVLKAIQDNGELFELDLDDVGVVTDVDTLDELSQAEALLRRRVAGGG